MKRFLSVTVFSGLLSFFRMVSGFLIAKIVAIHTGPTGIAMIGQLQNMLVMLNGAVCSPVGNGVVRYTAEHQCIGPEACAPWWRAALLWVIGFLVIAISITFMFASRMSIWLLGNSGYSWVIVIAGFSLPLVVANSALGSVINGYEKYRLYIGLGIASILISTCFTVLLIYKYGLQGALASTILSGGVAGLVMLIGSIRQPWFSISHWWGVTHFKHIRGIGGYILMACVSALCVPLSQMIVRNILVQQVGWNEAGYWQAINKISDAYLSVLTIALSTYFLPRLTALQSPKSIMKEVWGTARVVIPFVCLIGILIFNFRDIAISLLFTSEFKTVRSLFAGQLCGDVLRVLSWLFAFPMLSRGATGWFVFTEIMFFSLFVGSAQVFIGKYGLNGAIMSYLFSYAIYAVSLILLLPHIARKV